MKLSKILIFPLLILTLAAVLTVLQTYGNISFPPMILNAIRWAGITFLIYYAFRRRNLTTWILVSMILGAEIGYSFPEFAQNLNVLSKIFLRLIKTIIAPLIFATLVVGIAGHSNLKQVGKMGIKSLIYFEVVTTVALFIGLAAINISRAGEGIVL
ncbi:MAG: dicarboxylate/amino acid:cation symporter, partial [Cytophagales bacterium CG18_big_fil_WC_8_21_14_2_50_42_9]